MKFVSAPLAGFTNAAFRVMCKMGGADLTYTEMVSAAGLAHGSIATRRLMEVLDGESDVVCQLFGSKPDEISVATREISETKRFVGIDLNAGCPMPKVVREGAGAALVKNPQLIYDCLKAMKDATDLPITLKTRPGPKPDQVKMLEILDAAEKAGVFGITLHARFTSQAHGGDVHLDLLSELVSRSKVPITGNGSVVDRESALKMAQTGVKTIMIGRAALNNPLIFNELKNDVQEELTREKRLELFLTHVDLLLKQHEMLVSRYPDYTTSADDLVSCIFRTHLFRYFSGIRGSSEIRRRMNDIHTVKEVLELQNVLKEN